MSRLLDKYIHTYSQSDRQTHRIYGSKLPNYKVYFLGTKPVSNHCEHTEHRINTDSVIQKLLFLI